MVSERHETYYHFLFADNLAEGEAQSLLAPAGFVDWRSAAITLRRLARSSQVHGLPEHVFVKLVTALGNSASPDRALLNLQRWTDRLTDPDAFYRCVSADPRTLELLVTLFAGSQFLTDILLRTPVHFSLLTDRTALGRRKGCAEFQAEAQQCIQPYLSCETWPSDAPPTLDLLGFQQRELLRIGLGDLAGLLDLASVTSQLSYLAESIVQACLALVSRQARVGVDEFAVLAMGKLGGGELNYSSDIDLVFLAEDQSMHYQRLGQMLIRLLSDTTAQGFLYRVDMRLRPWGSTGPLVTTRRGYTTYLQQTARLWEKQALLKARVIAGSHALGDTFLSDVTPYLFTCDPTTVRADVYAMKQRTEAWLRQTGHDWGEVKLGEGSIRDIEFVVQYLQLVHGAAHPDVRTGNTADALARLAECGLLPADEYRVLTDGYLFLRTLEHYLQILDYQQTHALPSNPIDLHYLAQRLGFGGPNAAARLVTRYRQHSAAVRAIYHRHLAPLEEPATRAHRPLKDETGDRSMVRSARSPAQSEEHENSPRTTTPGVETADTSVQQHLARMSPSYAASFSMDEIRRHAALINHLSDDNLVEVEADALDELSWRVTIVAYDYLGELSLICGLLFAYGFSIIEGQVHTYEPQASAATAVGTAAAQRQTEARRKIVDVFTVRLAFSGRAGERNTLWSRYARDLAGLLQLLQARLQREAQGELAKRVAVALPSVPGAIPTLHPIDIDIDNETSDQYTVLRIDTPDTVGFLYEFTNALALNGVHIARVSVSSRGDRVHDTLYVTDAQGHKLVGPARERELRAATVLVKHFTHLLPHSPNPESALLHFHEHLGELFRRPSWPDELASLEQPEVLDALARLLGVSDFLWDDFLRMQYANLFPVVRNVGALAQAKDKVALTGELTAALASAPDVEARLAVLNAFKDREMFRIDMRHILGHIADFGQFSAELTDLVELVVATASQICVEHLSGHYGRPLDEQGRPIPFAVCVLGKCGGYELGYASDIEVMFIYDGSGHASGPRLISASEFFEKVVVEFMRAIWARREGIFEIDLDLRPYGKAGSLAVSLDLFRRYFAPGGPAWAYERQALIKLRAIGGDPTLGAHVEQVRDACVYTGAPFDVAAMRAMRERQLRHLVTPGTFNAKYSLGGLVDAEYAVQALQMRYGHLYPDLRVTNTRAAIRALVQRRLVSAQNGARLHDAHLFLQNLINALRVVRGNSKDLTIPPETSEEFAFLARRLGYGSEPARLQADLTHHTTWVRRLNASLVEQASRPETK